MAKGAYEPQWRLISVFLYCFPKLMLHVTKVGSIKTPPCSLGASVSWTWDGNSDLERQDGEIDRNYFFFFSLGCSTAAIGSWAGWQEAKEGWARPKRQDQFQSSWSPDPATQNLSGSPSRVRQGWVTLKLGLGGWNCISAKDWKVLLCLCVSVCVHPPGVCLSLWRGMGGFEVNDSNMVTSTDEMGDRGRWGYLAFPAPACLLLPNELSDSINERTESIIIIIS